jgi:hypothetical protein
VQAAEVAREAVSALAGQGTSRSGRQIRSETFHAKASAVHGVVRAVGLEPTLLLEANFKSAASANSATPALI